MHTSSPSSLAVFIGLAAWDTIALVPRLPEADSRVVAGTIVEAGGGPAATAAVACARLGIASAFIGAIGDDARGERIRASLESEGVDVSGIIVLPGAASTAAVILADQGSGTRALCPTLPPRLDLALRSPQAQRIAASAIVHVDQAGYQAVMTLREAAGLDVPVSVDAGNPIPGLVVEHTALFAPTLLQLRALLGPGHPAELLCRVVGPRWVAATDGADGAYIREGEQVWHVPAFTAAPCISTLGAGDVFHGALVAAWMYGFAAPQAAAYAGIVAGLSCRGLDGRSAIPDHETVMRLHASHPALPLTPLEV